MAGFANAQGSSCNGGHAFTICAVTYNSTLFTVIFDFYGIDGTHPGLPYGGRINLNATGFEPNQNISSNGVTTPAAVPEPGTFGLATAALLLSGFTIFRKKLLKG